MSGASGSMSGITYPPPSISPDRRNNAAPATAFGRATMPDDAPDATAPQEIEDGNANAATAPLESEDGYVRLAEWMGREPSMAIFRRFSALRALNLLRLQAELHGLEQELEAVWLEDKESPDPDRQNYAYDFWLMRMRSEDNDNTQYEIHKEIGKLLKEYDEALAAARRSYQERRPAKSDLEFFRTWLKHPNMGNYFLGPNEITIWDPDPAREKDLLTLRSSSDGGQDDDGFTSLLHGPMLDWFHALVGKRRKSRLEKGVCRYSDGHIREVGKGIVAAVSAVIPTVMILVLYFVKQMLIRIGLVMVFTTVFAVTLAVFTGAKKIEVFSAVAAFAAVEVVFIGSVSAQ